MFKKCLLLIGALSCYTGYASNFEIEPFETFYQSRIRKLPMVVWDEVLDEKYKNWIRAEYNARNTLHIERELAKVLVNMPVSETTANINVLLEGNLSQGVNNLGVHLNNGIRIYRINGSLVISIKPGIYNLHCSYYDIKEEYGMRGGSFPVELSDGKNYEVLDVKDKNSILIRKIQVIDNIIGCYVINDFNDRPIR